MEPLGAFPDGEWDCFCRMFASEEHDYSPQFLRQSSLLLREDDGLNIGIQSAFCSAPEAGEDDGLNIGIQSAFCSAPEAGEIERMFYFLDADHNSNLQYISLESSYSSNCSGDTVFIANPGHTNYHFSNPDHVLTNNTCISMDFCMMDEKNTGRFVPSLADIVMEENVSLNEDGRSDRLKNSDHSQVEPFVFPTKQLYLKRKFDVPELEVPAEDTINKASEHQKKKPRVLKDVQRCMKNARSKKNQKLARNVNEAEETHTGSDGQSSSSNSSEDDNASQENSGGATSASKSPAAVNLNGKTRASRGSATDPQSLYARKRRERINERLRILQNLVPNGTKVDISTMLEETVHYVKFLQLQIKLLSSDDLWMYAPIAYNGLGIGLNLNLKNPPPL